ncbi:hypothetical protein ACGFNU_30760 [Spirillospora sp. NPDC048911]|uniref:hypothetical protein n=1 Tax=Spirillospora sp. NPDC048911 TaxID=3364527 RepID=UPI003712873F
MFIQIIQGRISDAAEVKDALDRWVRELAPAARGWLGSTAGVTGDGTLVAFARFESREAARRNSDRPEQGQWWIETSKLFTAEVTFHDCAETDTWLGGGSDEAGFVQIMQNRVRDFAGLSGFMRQVDDTAIRTYRPEIIGSVMAVHEDGAGISEAVYFTSEAEARAGESQEMPSEMQGQWEQMMSFYEESEFTYLDLRTPWLYSP